MILKYKDNKEIIKHYFQCLQNKDWENFNFPDASELLMNEIDNVLCDYGQNFHGEGDFIKRSLDTNFPGWDIVYPGHYGKIGYGRQLAVQKAFDKGNRYCLFNDPICACEEIERIWFHKLKEEFKNNLDILYLKNVYDDLFKIVMTDGIEFSQVEMIVIIKNALHAPYPRRPVFDLNT